MPPKGKKKKSPSTVSKTNSEKEETEQTDKELIKSNFLEELVKNENEYKQNMEKFKMKLEKQRAEDLIPTQEQEENTNTLSSAPSAHQEQQLPVPLVPSFETHLPASQPPPPLSTFPEYQPNLNTTQPPDHPGYGYQQASSYGPPAPPTQQPPTQQAFGYGYGNLAPPTQQAFGYGYGNLAPPSQQALGYGYGHGYGYGYGNLAPPQPHAFWGDHAYLPPLDTQPNTPKELFGGLRVKDCHQIGHDFRKGRLSFTLQGQRKCLYLLKSSEYDQFLDERSKIAKMDERFSGFLLNLKGNLTAENQHTIDSLRAAMDEMLETFFWQPYYTCSQQKTRGTCQSHGSKCKWISSVSSVEKMASKGTSFFSSFFSWGKAKQEDDGVSARKEGEEEKGTCKPNLTLNDEFESLTSQLQSAKMLKLLVQQVQDLPEQTSFENKEDYYVKKHFIKQLEYSIKYMQEGLKQTGDTLLEYHNKLRELDECVQKKCPESERLKKLAELAQATIKKEESYSRLTHWKDKTLEFAEKNPNLTSLLTASATGATLLGLQAAAPLLWNAGSSAVSQLGSYAMQAPATVANVATSLATGYLTNSTLKQKQADQDPTETASDGRFGIPKTRFQSEQYFPSQSYQYVPPSQPQSFQSNLSSIPLGPSSILL